MQRPRELALHGADRDAEGLGDRGQILILEVAQDDHRPLATSQPFEATPDQVAVAGRVGAGHGQTIARHLTRNRAPITGHRDRVEVEARVRAGCAYHIDARHQVVLGALIERVQERQNIWLQVLGVLVTMKDGRTDLHKEAQKELKNHFKGDLFKTMITNNIKIEEAPSAFNSIFSYDSGCLGASLYRDWIKGELMRRHKVLEKKRSDRLEQINALSVQPLQP